jgi:hypothetical protein
MRQGALQPNEIALQWEPVNIGQEQGKKVWVY